MLLSVGVEVPRSNLGHVKLPLHYTDGGDFFISDITGLNDMTSTNSYKSGRNIIGTKYMNSVVQPRNIEIHFRTVYTGKTYTASDLRRKLYNIFPSGRAIDLILTNEFRRVYITVYMENISANMFVAEPEYVVKLAAPYPWYIEYPEGASKGNLRTRVEFKGAGKGYENVVDLTGYVGDAPSPFLMNRKLEPDAWYNRIIAGDDQLSFGPSYNSGFKDGDWIKLDTDPNNYTAKYWGFDGRLERSAHRAIIGGQAFLTLDSSNPYLKMLYQNNNKKELDPWVVVYIDKRWRTV